MTKKYIDDLMAETDDLQKQSTRLLIKLREDREYFYNCVTDLMGDFLKIGKQDTNLNPLINSLIHLCDLLRKKG